MENQPVVIAGGALVVGILLSVAITDGRVNSKIARGLERTADASAATVAEAADSMSARIAELEAALDERATTAAAAVNDKLAALQQEMDDKLAAASQVAEAQTRDLEAALAKITAMGAGASAPAPLPDGLQTSEALSIGQTAVFADGAVRAFVSGFDASAGTARLSINGTIAPMRVGTAQAVAGADCMVAVTALDADGVVIGSDCGAAAEVPPAPESGHKAGTMAMLADGALRVFVSGLAADGSAARIAVNGVDMLTVQSGTSVDVMAGDQTCSVTVTGVGNGLVGLDGTCG